MAFAVVRIWVTKCAYDTTIFLDEARCVRARMTLTAFLELESAVPDDQRLRAATG
jgi:hypothetical protein